MGRRIRFLPKPWTRRANGSVPYNEPWTILGRQLVVAAVTSFSCINSISPHPVTIAANCYWASTIKVIGAANASRLSTRSVSPWCELAAPDFRPSQVPLWRILAINQKAESRPLRRSNQRTRIMGTVSSQTFPLIRTLTVACASRQRKKMTTIILARGA